MPTPPPRTDRNQWYHQPIAWFGLVVFVLSVAGCVWIIVASVKYDDAPVAHHAQTVLGVPVSASSSRRPQP